MYIFNHFHAEQYVFVKYYVKYHVKYYVKIPSL